MTQILVGTGADDHTGDPLRTAYQKVNRTMTDWFNVLSYGAIGNGVADDTAAIVAAITAARLAGGGTVYLPAGTYLCSSTIDMTASNTGQPITLQGAGTRVTVLKSSVTTTAAINAANSTTRFQAVQDMSVYQSSLAVPTSLSAGNYGIRNTTGVGYQLNISRVEINYFSNSAIYIEGPTGPTNVYDCSIQQNYGWGIETAVAVSGPQNVNIINGNIQWCGGGIKFSGVNGCHVIGADVELQASGGVVARFPAVYLTAGSNGCSFVNFTTSIAAGVGAITPNGVRVIDNGNGNVFYGGIDTCSNGSSTANYLIGGAANCYNNTIVGGIYANTSSGGGYWMDTTLGNVFCTVVINPYLNAATFTAGKAFVNDAQHLSNFIIGIDTVNNFAGGWTVGTPASTMALTGPQASRQTALTWGASVAVDASHGTDYFLAATSNIAATIATPTLVASAGFSQRLRFVFLNSSGGALSTPIAFSAAFKTSGGVSPANGLRITVEFTYDQANALWIEQARSAAV